MTKFKIQVINRHRLLTDGDGVTTLIGLLGCPLKCKYCLNMNVHATGHFREMTPKELLDEIMIDFCYFVSTGGGLTFGGAEPLLQIEPLLEFIDILPEFVNTNIESCLNVDIDEKTFATLATKVSSFIIDIKALDENLYKEYTGLSNNLTMANLERICKLKLQNKCKIRIPVIPDYKDRETAEEEAKIIKEMGFTNVEIFPYIIRDYMN